MDREKIEKGEHHFIYITKMNKLNINAQKLFPLKHIFLGALLLQQGTPGKLSKHLLKKSFTVIFQKQLSRKLVSARPAETRAG